MMLTDLIQKGLVYSQNPLFKKLMGKAGGVMTKPVKLGILLSTAYGKLVDVEKQQSGFQQLKGVMQAFVRMVKAYANGSYRNISKKSMIITVAVLLYLITPFDIIPDFIPAIGLMDDLSIMAWFVSSFEKEIIKFQEWEAEQSFEPTLGSL
ncbi:YkvA family protein [Pontibacter silvestris]|uniref:YkvA family protein n=1 Tax=Pontibacter silvestris TaxID=2305183 RepID=A0ABW4WWX5_9BACT|nr:DUF1232 domain-containing protein [Pontibacter silvestris]MCC9137393.1 DUF1232 domain-containing protein [Pontibacter silvestris]